MSCGWCRCRAPSWRGAALRACEGRRRRQGRHGCQRNRQRGNASQEEGGMLHVLRELQHVTSKRSARPRSCRVMGVLYGSVCAQVKWGDHSTARSKIAPVCSRTHGGRRCEFVVTVSVAPSGQGRTHGPQPGKLQKCWRNRVPVLPLQRARETLAHTHVVARHGRG
jgi:hypothetical protein